MSRRFISVLVLAVSSMSYAPDVKGGWDEAKAALKVEDYPTAVKELIPIADDGHVYAQLQLGLILRSGLGGVPKDSTRAFGYLLIAAQNDQWNSQYIVAGMYSHGWGVKKDDAMALKWASIAAGRGSETGLNLASSLRETLDTQTRKRIQVEVDRWYQATLIDGRPFNEYSVSCGVLGMQIGEAKSFMEQVKTDKEAKQLHTKTGIQKWVSLAMVYPSGSIALDDVSRRYNGLLDIKKSNGCTYLPDP